MTSQPERNLLPDNGGSSTTTTNTTNATTRTTTSTVGNIQCTANVVGVVPSEIVNIIIDANANNSTTTTTTSANGLSSAKLDDYSSGLSYLIQQCTSPPYSNTIDTSDENSAAAAVATEKIVLWEHSTQTMNEQVVPPNFGLCGVTLLHPEHSLLLLDTNTLDNNNTFQNYYDHSLLVVCLKGLSGTRRGSGGSSNRSNYNNNNNNNNNNRDLRHVYSASPITGVLCLWILDAAVVKYQKHNIISSGSSNKAVVDTAATAAARDGLPCDASVRLKLKHNEVLTSLVPLNTTSSFEGDGTTSSSSWLLASTSHGRIWKIYKTSRPLTLHAKLVKRQHNKDIFVHSGNAERASSGMRKEEALVPSTSSSTGIVWGLYNYLTTPSKPSTNNYRNDSLMVLEKEDDNMECHHHHHHNLDDENNNIVAVIPLCQTAVHLPTPSKYSQGSGFTRSPPPRKQQRLSNRGVLSTPLRMQQYSSSSPPSWTHVISISSTLVVKKWNIYSIAGGMEAADEVSKPSHIDFNGTTSAHQEGCTSAMALFPRRGDGTLDLSKLIMAHSRKSSSSSSSYELGVSITLTSTDDTNLLADEDNAALLEGYDTLDMLATPTLSKDGNSIIVGIRITKTKDVDATRAYVIRLGLPSIEVNGNDRNGNSSTPCFILDAVWLDRYSGQSLSKGGGAVECAGLVVAEGNDVEEGILVDDDENNDNIVSSMIGGSVVYIGFGPRCGATTHATPRAAYPVTISVIHFPPVNLPCRSQNSPRVKDLDMPSTHVPSIVPHSMSYDSVTGGCVLLSTASLLCGIHVRFPPVMPTVHETPLVSYTTISPAVSLNEESLSLLSQDESVITIKTHLQSSFRQYATKLKEVGVGSGGAGGSSNNAARALIPPSVMTCPVLILSAAVVLASKDIVCASCDGGGGGGGGGVGRGLSSPLVSQQTISGSNSYTNTPVIVLRDKLHQHKTFVTFLLQAGAYRRVSNVGRVRLRDHGEMITATRTLLSECQNCLKAADDAMVVGGDDLMKVRQMVSSALDGASNDVLSLPKRWIDLQRLIVPNAATSLSPFKAMLLLMTSSSLCEGIGKALTYRESESMSLYDVIPMYISSSLPAGCSPWTSSPEMLEVLLTQLKFIQQMGEYILSSSKDYESDKVNMGRFVEDLSATVLSGYRDVVSLNPSNNEALRTYAETKSLTCELLRRYVNYEEDDIVALNTSVNHSFFEGILQICHDHRTKWMYQGPFADEIPDDRYDLRKMIASSSVDSPYARLHQSRDYATGLSFCNFVLRWYTDRGLYSEVFELGNHCLHDLTRFVRNDLRLSNLAWRQHLRINWHEKATTDLLEISTPVLFGKDIDVLSIWEKEQMLSLAKLSNKLVVATDEAHSKNVENRAESIEDGLTLISAQRALRGDDGNDKEVVLDSDNILKLLVKKIESSSDLDEVKRLGIYGLSLASAKPSDQSDAISDAASNIWHALIMVDIKTWQDVANSNASDVGGMEEEVLMNFVEGTAFVGLLYDFQSNSKGGKLDDVSFNSIDVKNKVFRAFGSNELARVLSISADIVANAT